jgi:translation initiation factor 1 (eIF-1/SUI1)
MNPFDDIEINNNNNNIDNRVNIEIWVEENRKKKNTFISGWNLSDVLLKEHIKIIKKKKGCNGTLKILEDNNITKKVILLQGDHISYIKTYLIEQDINSNDIHIRG